MKAAATRLWRLGSKLERQARGYESLLPSTWPPLHVYAGAGHPRFLLYCTKEALLQRWVMDEAFPRGWIALSRYGLPTPEYLNEIRGHMNRHRLPLQFVGDLDPLDLTIFAILRHGEARLAGRSRRLTVHYLGIDDRWLALCDQRRRRGHSLEDALIRMGEIEREHWSTARDVLPDAERLVGPRCFALLESGRKLEIEGVSNVGFYGDDFPARLLGRLRRRSSR